MKWWTLFDFERGSDMDVTLVALGLVVLFWLAMFVIVTIRDKGDEVKNARDI